MSRIRPKIQGYKSLIDAEATFDSVGGARESLRMHADFVIKKLLKRIGPNARGRFELRLEFWPKGNYDNE